MVGFYETEGLLPPPPPPLAARPSKWKVFGPWLKGFDFHAEFDSASDAVARATELARLHTGHEFHIAKVIRTYRVKQVAPPIETITYN